MKKHVQLNKTKIGDDFVYQLMLIGIEKDMLKILFLPSLQKISFIQINDQIIVELKDDSFNEMFIKWVSDLYENLIDSEDIGELIKRFNEEIKKHIYFFSKEKTVSIEKIRGLYGELLELKRVLLIENVDKSIALDGWHRPAPANHDFDFKNYSLEVKATGRTSSTVKISSENQLDQVENKNLILKVSKLDAVPKSSEDSLAILFNEIKTVLGSPLNIQFENKCAEDAFFKYLGPEHVTLDYKIWEIDSDFHEVDQDNFPRLSHSSIPNGISSVKYEIDLSSIDSFKTAIVPCPQN